MRNCKFLSFIILILLLLTSSLLPAQEKESEIASSAIDEIFYLINKEFYQDINKKELLYKSMESLSEILKTGGLPAEIALLPATDDEDLLLYSYRKNLAQILELYGEEAGKNFIMKTAISGLLEALDDPYTVYFDEEEYKKFNSSLSGGDFYGIGVLIKLDKNNDNLLTVIDTMKNTPARRAGIVPGDVILEIDTISTAGLTLEESAALLEGSRGTKVKLVIKRKEEKLEMEIVRDKIHVSSVETELLENNTGYIKLDVFGKDTNKDLDEGMKELEKLGAKAYILDLRNNGGGYVAAAIDLCSKFMPTDSVVVYIKSKNDKINYNSYGSTYKSLPLAVLVNEHSASASEIAAGALQDSGVAKIIGTKTFGKGIVQTIFKLDKDGGAVKITTASYITPDGRMIDKKGLDPDITVEMDVSKIGGKEDIQLEKAKEYILTQIKD